jgi:D-alanine-D-alanine ligase
VRKLRILALMHPMLVPPDDVEQASAREAFDWKTEYDVVRTLRGLGHQVRPLGVQDELRPIREAKESWQPHLVFNLLEEFHGKTLHDHSLVSYLELQHMRYTGCNPRGLVIARSKALAKKLVAYHRIQVPGFAVFPVARRIRRPPRLGFPLIVKSLIEHASLGIAQASVVDSDAKLEERVAFVHEHLETDAIAERFIEGRELYVGVLGNERVKTLPVWELLFENMPPNAPRIATARVKHDPDYQTRRGIMQGPAQLPADLAKAIQRTAKRIYRILELDGYARIDFRLRADGRLFFLEANPNPEIAEQEEFAQAALHIGIEYPALLQQIVRLGIRRGGRASAGPA